MVLKTILGSTMWCQLWCFTPFLNANDTRSHLIFANGGYTLLLGNNTSRL